MRLLLLVFFCFFLLFSNLVFEKAIPARRQNPSHVESYANRTGTLLRQLLPILPTMANDVNNTESNTQITHVDRPENNNTTTKDLVPHPKQTTQITKDQQENERITGDIFYPFSTDRPIPTKIYTPSAKHFEYKTRPKYIHTKLSLRQIHKLDDDEYESL